MGLWNELKKLGRKIDDKILQPVKNSIKNIGKDPLNAVLTIAALATNNAWALPYINAGTALAAGAKPADVLKAAAAAYVASYVTSGVVKSDIAKTLIGDSKLVENIATGGIRGGLTAALQGKDFSDGVISGVINQGVAYGMQQVSGYTGDMIKAKFPEFITSAKELGSFFNFTPAGPREINIYREDDGSKFIYDNQGNILGGVDNEGNSIIGNKGTYVVVDPSNRGLSIYNLAGEYIGGDSVGGATGALGDLSDFPEGARVNIIQDQKDGLKYPNRLPLDQRLAIQKQMDDIAYEMDGLEYGDPARAALESQRNDLWAKSQGIGAYAPPEAPVVEAPPQYAANQLVSQNPGNAGMKFFRNDDGTVTIDYGDGRTNRVPSSVANTVYNLKSAPPPTEAVSRPVETTPILPEPVRPPDSEYIQQDQQEGPVAPEIAGPLPQPVPPVVEPVAPTTPLLGSGIKLPTAPVSGPREVLLDGRENAYLKFDRMPDGNIQVTDRSNGIAGGMYRPGSEIYDRFSDAPVAPGETGITPGAGGETGITPGAGGETGITLPPAPPAPLPPTEQQPMPPITLLPPTNAPVIGDGGLGTGIVPGQGGETGITPGAGGETGLIVPTPPPQLETITTTPTPELPLGPIRPVEPEPPTGAPVAPAPPTTTTPQDPPIPQQNQFPSADKWLEALQKYLTNTAISAVSRGIVGGLVQQAQKLIGGGPSPVAPPVPGNPPTSGSGSGSGVGAGAGAAAGLGFLSNLFGSNATGRTFGSIAPEAPAATAFMPDYQPAEMVYRANDPKYNLSTISTLLGPKI